MVNSLADTVISGDGLCTLREAITAANTNTSSGGVPGECPAGGMGVDRITFSVNGTVVLGSQLPSITTPITIDGTGRTIAISGNNTVRVFYVESFGNLTLNAITVKNGRVTGEDNGGGIYNFGTLTVINSTLSGNSAASGGAIYNNSSNTLTVTNSTFSGNSASTSGGGIYTSGPVTVTHSTFSGNSSSLGGGIYRNWGTVYLAATILDSGASGDNCAGGVTNNGYNLSDDASCGFGGTSLNDATLKSRCAGRQRRSDENSSAGRGQRGD